MRLAFALAALGLALSARADVVVSTLGPGDTFRTDAAHFVGGAGSLFGYEGSAVAFTPGQSVFLDSVEVAFQHFGDPNGYLVSIAPQVAGQPGPAIETWTFNGALTPELSLLSSAAHPLLTAGTTYWLTMQPTDADQFGAWFVNNLAITSGGMKVQPVSSGTAWQATPTAADLAYRIQGTPVAAPEPSALLLLGVCGAIGGVALRIHARGVTSSRLRSGPSISASATESGSAPE